MAFADYTEFIEPLELPIRGKTYRIPAMSLETGLRLKPFLSGQVPKGMTDAKLAQLTLGDAYDEMTADSVPVDAINRAMLVALAEYQSGRAAAELIWKTGGDPKAVEAEVKRVTNRAQRRSKSSAGAGTTK